jgi:hypothetical protein
VNGSDNEHVFAYLGHVYNDVAGYRYTHGRKSKIGADSASAKAFDWFWRVVVAQRRSVDQWQIDVWHESRCGRCGRKLTVPESIESGFGPECLTKV